MNKESIIAYSLTIAIFLGGAFYFIGVPEGMNMPDFSLKKLLNVNKAAVSSETTYKKKRKKTKGSMPEAKVVDVLNGVNIYYNGRVSNVRGRATTKDGYNLGLKYQCVEFVKRYYYERYNHKMPDSYGHAKEFFDKTLTSGSYNSKRGLFQYMNNTAVKPKLGDILVFGSDRNNDYGHVVIVSQVTNEFIEIAQQNPGANNSSRAKIPMINRDGIWELRGANILGWLSQS